MINLPEPHSMPAPLGPFFNEAPWRQLTSKADVQYVAHVSQSYNSDISASFDSERKSDGLENDILIAANGDFTRQSEMCSTRDLLMHSAAAMLRLQ